ncbi:MAG TPA: DUF4199 domain-containing protein [Flavobacterium sp.]|nr:DUF4199 domain-containing protein [Flavobacterium sp.]
MKNFSIEIKWGIIFTIASLLWMVLEKLVGLHDAFISRQLIYTNLFGFVAIAIYILAIMDKKKNFYHGNMDWQRGFLSGVIMAIVVACLNPLVNYITYTFISTNYFSEMINYQVSHNHMTLEKAQGIFNMDYYLYKDAIPDLSMGVVVSAVVALFLKTKSPSK